MFNSAVHLVKLFILYSKIEARDFELDALNLSTNDDEGFAAIKTNKKLEMVEKGKRNCNKPLRYCDTEDESTPMQKNSGTNNIRMPPATYVSHKDQQPPPTFKTPIASHHSTSENQVKSSHSTYKSMTSFDNTDENNTDNDLVGIPPASFSQDPDSFWKDGAQSPRLNNDTDSIDIPFRIIRDHSRQSSIKQPSPPPIQPLAELKDDDQMSLPGSDTHGHGCCRKVLSELKSLKALISTIYLTISDKNNNANNDTVRETVDFGLPIQTRSQLAAFENKIQNVVASTQYVSFFIANLTSNL
ncbi:hypothetical protein RR48_00689 [Papilio machaon]|uniref:Uncharacterized protein n=1 Tax=Papilio machaon TaxID=76193 RepID=A0A0N1IJQ5_PAPMA|nr:hypothetical protein RR48_00689 [Papilio machaon]